MADLATAIPKGSTVLVTGITGFLASHITKQLLDHGFKVRGTTRNPSSAAWVTEEEFPDAAKAGNLELVALEFGVSDESAYATAVKGVHGVIHVATIQTFDPNPENVIVPVLAGVSALLKAAAQEPTIKRFVYTSSSVASFVPNFFSEETLTVTRDSWNDIAVQLAQRPPPYTDPRQGGIVYMASKVQAEKAVWKFAEESKPGFDVNVVSPYTLVGPILHKSYATKNLPGWFNQLWHGQVGLIKNFPALFYVNVKDVALLHLAALIDPEVKDARIQAWCTPFNWNIILTMWREKFPDKKFIEDLPNMGRVNAKIDDTYPKQLLKKWGNQDGWVSMEVGVQETMDSVLAATDA